MVLQVVVGWWFTYVVLLWCVERDLEGWGVSPIINCVLVDLRGCNCCKLLDAPPLTCVGFSPHHGSSAAPPRQHPASVRHSLNTVTRNSDNWPVGAPHSTWRKSNMACRTAQPASQIKTGAREKCYEVFRIQQD